MHRAFERGGLDQATLRAEVEALRAEVMRLRAQIANLEQTDGTQGVRDE